MTTKLTSLIATALLYFPLLASDADAANLIAQYGTHTVSGTGGVFLEL